MILVLLLYALLSHLARKDSVKTIKLAFLITVALMALGCEYIQLGTGNSMSIAHKGNCKNPIHIYNIEKGTQLENKDIPIQNAITNMEKISNNYYYFW